MARCSSRDTNRLRIELLRCANDDEEDDDDEARASGVVNLNLIARSFIRKTRDVG